jgi:thiosulfate dehydrogenase
MSPMLAALWLSMAAPILPASTLDWRTRVKDPERDPLPADAHTADEVRRGYRLFLDTRELGASSLSCGSCHLNAGQKEGALPLVGIAKAFPEYNKRAGRNFTLAERIVG